MLEYGRDVIRVGEPGGSEFADALRPILKNGDIPRNPIAEYLGFTAARVDMFYEKAESALKAGIDILEDRNHESSKIFQGYGGGVNLELIDTVNKLILPSRLLKPTRTILLIVLDETVRQQRLADRPKHDGRDAFEDREVAYLNRVHQGYVDLAQNPSTTVVDASGTPEEIRDLVWAYIKTDLDDR